MPRDDKLLGKLHAVVNLLALNVGYVGRDKSSARKKAERAMNASARAAAISPRPPRNSAARRMHDLSRAWCARGVS
jgi:hypothetical protein